MNKINLKGKALFFLDLMGGMYAGKTPEDEVVEHIAQLIDKGIHIKDYKLVEYPPFRGREQFDYLFFDWGGMSVGNSCLDSFSRYFLQDAEENPDKLYIVISDMTKDAVIDAQREFAGKELPKNVFLDMEAFIAYIEKYKTMYV